VAFFIFAYVLAFTVSVMKVPVRHCFR